MKVLGELEASTFDALTKLARIDKDEYEELDDVFTAIRTLIDEVTFLRSGESPLLQKNLTILYWGPKDSGKSDAAFQKAIKLGLELSESLEFKEKALHLVRTNNWSDVEYFASQFLESGQGVLLIEYETSIAPNNVYLFDEVFQFPQQARS